MRSGKIWLTRLLWLMDPVEPTAVESFPSTSPMEMIPLAPVPAPVALIPAPLATIPDRVRWRCSFCSPRVTARLFAEPCLLLLMLVLLSLR